MLGRAISLAVAGALALSLASCGEKEAAAPAAVAARGERLKVMAAPLADMKPVAATVTTRNMADARARIGGTLVKLLVREGDMVRQGQLIATVKDERLGLETAAYNAQAIAAAAEAARAEADLGRTRTLYDQGIYAKARLDQVEAAAKAAQANLAAARAQSAASAELAGQGAILAPAAGRILKAEVPVGSVVAQGQAVATITAGELLLRIEIPESQAVALRVGDSVTLQASDLPGSAPTGIIAQVYPSVTTGLVTADVRVAGLPSDRIGARVRAWVKVGERTAIAIPRRFISTRFGVDYVRLVHADGSAGDVPVQTAPTADPAVVEVLSGLASGDTLVRPEPAR